MFVLGQNSVGPIFLETPMPWPCVSRHESARFCLYTQVLFAMSCNVRVVHVSLLKKVQSCKECSELSGN
jgi:hypothetical protein